ncbi:hypothetical protein A4X13_0g7214 [Tilletia indica]|uniref:Ndc10 domain-containing protein n=1 Tax=Tilletia indica TaxID=43049 RepID=A0A177TLT0_9BASI|nr:hypothetical protein A4X13_0g7214 [Tilletia indica]
MVEETIAAGIASATSLVAASAKPGSLAVGGRGVKRRADGVVYTRDNKLIAVYYMFGSPTSRALSVADRVKRLKVNRPTLYEWRKEFTEAWQSGKVPEPGSELAQTLAQIRARTDEQNIAVFLTPNDHVAGILAQSSGGSVATAGGASFSRPDGLGPQAEPAASFSPHQPGDLPPEVVEILRRVDGQSDITLAEQNEVAAQIDGDVAKEAALLVETTITQAATLQRDSLRPSTNKLWDRPKQNFIMFWRGLERLRAGAGSATTPASASAAAPTSLLPSTTTVPPLSGSSTSSASPVTTPLPATTSLPAALVAHGSPVANRNIIVTEQKLVTYLNCFVLHRNPRLGEEAIKTEVKAITNLWETQRILGINSHPSPRTGGLIKAYLKAISRSRAALAEAVREDWWKHSLKDGYDENEYLEVARWFLQQASFPIRFSSTTMSTSPNLSTSSSSTITSSTASSPPTNSSSSASALAIQHHTPPHASIYGRSLATRERLAKAALRGRFEFLMQHALMGRSEDLRNAKLAATYTIAVPQSRPQPSTAFVVTLRSGKANTTGRNEWGVAARHKDVEKCPVGALAMYLFERWDVLKKSFPSFDSRESWYQERLLVSEQDDEDDSIEWTDQAYIVRHAFENIGIASSKVTHAMRSGGARFAHDAGCTEDSLRIHGRWCGDRLIDRYLGGVAIQPVRALGGWSINGGDHWLPRTLVQPSVQLQQQIFPHLEAEEIKVQQRHKDGGETDNAALNFFSMLKWLRVVLLQDSVLLQPLFPDLPIWRHAPFTSPAFSAFSDTLKNAISATPSPFEVTIASLVPQLGNALGAVQATLSQLTLKTATGSAMEQQAEMTRATINTAFEGITRLLCGRMVAEDARERAQRALAFGAQQLANVSVELASTSSSPGAVPSPSEHRQDDGASQELSPLLPLSQSSSSNMSSPSIIDHLSPPLPTPSATPPTPLSIAAQQPPTSPQASCRSSILEMALEIRTVGQLMREWRQGSGGRRPLQDRVREGDDTLQKGSGSARKQLSRWRLIVAVVEEMSAERNEVVVVAAMDNQLTRDKVGLRALADKRGEQRKKWIEDLGLGIATSDITSSSTTTTSSASAP